MTALLLRSRFYLAALIFSSAASLTAQPAVLGTVFGSSGQPVAGAQIELMPVLSNFETGRLRLAGQRDPTPVAEGRSDVAGRYCLRAPAAGVFKIVIRADGQVPMQYSPLSLVEDKELPPASLAADAEIRLVVRDAAGRPLARAWALAAGSAERKRWVANAWRTDIRVGRTGADGSISLPRLRTERLDVSVFPPGEAEVRQLDFEGGTLTLTAGGGTARRLRVVSPKGAPREGILVRVGNLAWPIGLTDAEGRLNIPHAPRAAEKVRLVAPDGRQQTSDLPAETAESEVIITLADPVILSGRVKSQETGQPLAGALISPGLDPGAFLLTDAEGGYRLVASDPEGFPLQVQAADHLPRAVRLTSTHLRARRAPTLALPLSTAVRGLVVDALGVPIAGTTVFALPDVGGERDLSAALLTTAMNRGATDGSGRFELRPLRAGSFYEIRAVRPGYLPGSAKTLAPAPSRAAPPLKIVLFPARSARGQVQDVSGRPVVGAEVRLAPAGLPGSRRPPKEPTEQSSPFVVRTDAQGRFLVAQIPAARVDLTAHQRGYAVGHVRGIRIPPGTEPMDLGTVTLRPGARLQGRVIDRAGKPIAGAAVHRVENIDRLEQEDGRLKDETPDAVTGLDGSFIIEDLPQATPFNLLVHASGYLPTGVRGVRAPASKPLAIRVESAATLRGRVLDEQGSPVAGARVVLTWQPSAPGNPERPTGAPVERSDVSDRDGRFEIRDSPAGPVRLAVSAQGYTSIEDFEAVVPWPNPSQELTLTLKNGAVLTGRIVTTAGQPVSGARISVEGVSELSDDDGAYTLEGVPLGRTDVQVFHPAYKRFRRELIIEPGVNPLDVTFEEGVEVSGRVMDGQRTPVMGARIVLLQDIPRHWQEYRERSLEDGTFRFSAVARGRYRLEVSGEGYATTEIKQPVIVQEEPVDGLEIVLESGGAITGRVLGLEVDQLAQVEVAAQTDDGESFPAFVDATGHYEIRHLRPGDYLVQANLESGQRHVQARVPLPPEEEEVIRDLQFTSRVTLSGQVLYDEKPLSEAKISIRGNRLAVERSIWTDFQGAFRFEDLEPDTYWLGLSHPRELLVHNDTIELAADRDITIRLSPSTVSGMVTDIQTRRPITGAFISLRHIEGSEFLITDSAQEDGTFSVHRVPAGSYLLTVRAPGYSLAEQKLAVSAGQDVSGLEVTLAATRGLELMVRLASGRVPDRVHLRALDSAGTVALTETRPTDPSGKVIVSTLPEGSWTLVLGAPGGAPVVIPVTVPGDPIPVTLPEAGQLRLKVPALARTDLRASAILSTADQPFWIIGPGGNLQNQWQLVGGRGLVEGIPAGHWRIRVEAPDGRVWMGQVMTPGQGEVEVTLE